MFRTHRRALARQRRGRLDIVNRDLRVLHITEASSAGVLHAAGGLARRQANSGATVEFAYIRRPDSPTRAEIEELLAPAVAVEFGSDRSGIAARFRALRERMRDAARGGRYDVIHAHSSLAGAALRLGRRMDRSTVNAYSPHGFAFLREDVPWFVRKAFLLAERAGSRRGLLIAASPSEAAMAKRVLRPRATAVVANGVAGIVRREPLDPGSRPVVGMVGRIAYQKAPWRFADLATELSEIADFVWVGDGSDRDKRRWIGDAPVRITGWLRPDEVRSTVSTFAVLCFATLWEGMPLALLEAQALGVPAVATRIVGNEDIVKDGETGYLVDSDAELRFALTTLINDPEQRARMGERAAASVAHRFDADRLAAASLGVYSRELSPRR